MPDAQVGVPAPQPAAESADPVCGKCGYCVRGIEGLTCPECGSDLREVGILTSRHRRPATPWVYFALWTLALPIGAILVSVLLMRTVIPFSQTSKVHRTIFFQAPPYLFTTLQVNGAAREWQPPLAQRTPIPPQILHVQDQGSGRWLEINMNTRGYSYRTTNGSLVQSGGGMNGGVLADWLGTCGINAADPRVRSLCDAAYPALADISQGGALAAGFMPINDASGRQLGIAHPAVLWTVYDEPHPAVIAALAAFWLLLWIYGIRRIHRRTRHAPPITSRECR
jgi:hypothetical protein